MRICLIVDLAVPTDHSVKIKENEKRNKYLDLAREQKKLCNIEVTVIAIIIGGFGTIPKGFVNGLDEIEIGGRAKTTQITALLKSASILRGVLET